MTMNGGLGLGAWDLALKEVQDGGLPCGSIKASAEGGLETAKRFKAPGQLREARRAAAMEQGNPPSCAGNAKTKKKAHQTMSPLDTIKQKITSR
jgi:hypothetical protein